MIDLMNMRLRYQRSDEDTKTLKYAVNLFVSSENAVYSSLFKYIDNGVVSCILFEFDLTIGVVI